MSAVLEVEGLSIDYLSGGRPVRALSEVSLSIAAGETVGVVGESGSGKSTLAFAVARYLPGNARIASGAIRLVEQDVLAADAETLKRMRRTQFGMVYQNAAAALNPTHKIGEQVLETITITGTPKAAAPARARDLLDQVQLRDPAAIMDRFPHQVSGGERQRVLIAMAIAGNPRLLVLDEPTTALDPETARDVLDLIAGLRNRLGAAVLYISHDLETVSRLTDRLVVLKDGAMVEQGATRTVLDAPQHEYTRLLLASRPGQLAYSTTIAAARSARPPDTPRNLMSVGGLSVAYGRSGLLAQLGIGARHTTPALADASFEIPEGRTTAVVGRSGSGKSTLAKALVGLVPFTGALMINGCTYVSAGDLDQAYRRAVQIVFQNPDTSLNPRHRIGEILSRPLRLLGAPVGRADVAALLEQVQLPAEFADRFPHQLSGGQRQRASIARALAAKPKLVICDEITSALDVSTQAAIISLLMNLQAEHGTAFLFISHDLELVRSFADRTIVVDGGRIVAKQ